MFFDLKKAFDSVPHRPLLELLSKLNLPGNLLAWLQSYLTSRSQQVVVKGATSFKIPVISGVPQGSILEPLLFILYVNEIFQLPFSSSSTVILYADDILLSCPINLPSNVSIIQSDINTLSSWAKHKLLTFNHSKTKYMLISRKRPASLYCLPPLTLDGTTSLEQVSSFTILELLYLPLFPGQLTYLWRAQKLKNNLVTTIDTFTPTLLPSPF